MCPKKIRDGTVGKNTNNTAKMQSKKIKRELLGYHENKCTQKAVIQIYSSAVSNI